MKENKNNEKNHSLSFESLDILIAKWKEGTFGEILDDWKWILSYSKKYKGVIVFYTLLGIMIAIMLGSVLFSLVFSNLINRISAKLSIDINNYIQADIFNKIVDSDWLEINKYSNGDVLNRFNSDVSTVSANAISWLPKIVIAV